MNLEQVVKKVLKERQDQIIEAMINGAPTFDEYRYLVGKIQGMSYFMEDIQKYLRDPDQLDEEGR